MKMKMILMALVGLAMGAVCAVETPQKQASAAKMGGFLNVRGTPCGKILIVNAQKRVGKENFDIGQQRATFSRLATVTEIIEGPVATIDNARAMKEKYKANFALFIVDVPDLPPSLVAVEEHWAIMNVAALAKDARTAEMVRIRARNEFARVYGMLCGGFCSQYKAPLTNYIKDVADLDNVLFELPVDYGQRLYGHLAFNGVKPVRKVPYATACREGWAPAPTNDVQKAIWDKVHAMPTAPLTIKPETKKVKD